MPAERRGTWRGVRVAWTEAGDGPRHALFLHGITASRRLFEPILADPPTGWRFVAVDVPGFGDSGLPRRRQGLADFVAFVLDFTTGWPPFALVGHSFGGMLAAEATLAAPARVFALVLVTPAGFIPPAVPTTVPPAATLNALLVRLVARLRPEALLEGVALPPTAVDEAWAPRLRHGLLRAREAFRMRRFYETAPLGPRLAAAGQRAVYLLGDRDPIFPLADLLPALGPGPALVLRGEGHVPMVGAPGAFARCLRRALTGGWCLG